MDIQTLAQQLGEALKQQNCRLVTAESCTGGGLAAAITEIPGSSRWFERGFVTYSNESKQELLEINTVILNTHGAVSQAVAQAMAEGALSNSHADISISITGIAGPEGGAPDKPVGTVWFGCATKNRITDTYCAHFTGNRHQIREQSISFALQTLLQHCLSALCSEQDKTV